MDKVTLNVASGQMVALIGPNGAGKSTLLNIAACTIRPQQGRVTLGETDLQSMSARKRAQKVAMVSQNPGMPFAYSVRELVALGRSPYLRRFGSETRSDHDAIDKAMAVCGITKLAERSVTQVSGGEMQRVWLALALAQEPEILLLDEVTAHLDIAYQVSMFELIAELNRSSKLTVLATIHDLNLAALFFRDIAVLHHGSLVTSGEPQAVLNPDLIDRVFGSDVGILKHPTEQIPLIALNRKRIANNPAGRL